MSSASSRGKICSSVSPFYNGSPVKTTFHKGIPYFREIERLSVGDSVSVTNLWETLEYTVVGWEIVSPDSIDHVLIQPGRDLLTLVTCHPYRVGTQRYLVYCERVPDTPDGPQIDKYEPSVSVPSEKSTTPTAAPAEPVAESSQQEIESEAAIQLTGLVVVVFTGIGLLLVVVRNGKQKF